VPLLGVTCQESVRRLRKAQECDFGGGIANQPINMEVVDMRLYGIWCKDAKNNNGDWLRELPSNVQDGGEAILVYTSQSAAQQRAAEHYGFGSYADVKVNGWAEVRLVGESVHKVSAITN
jgi:hypothetical protein